MRPALVFALQMAVQIFVACTPLFADDEPGVACNPSSPAAVAGSSVGLNVWFQAPRGTSIRYQWKADAGSVVKARNGSAVWNLKRVSPGEHSTDVDVIVNGKKAASCSIYVLVTREDPALTRGVPDRQGGSELTGRAFLIEGKRELPDFALYSYLLFSAPPSTSDVSRYQAVAEAILRLMRPLDDLARTLKPSQLNTTFIPVIKAPTGDPNAKWLLDNYDYTAATILLQRAGIGPGSTGPYIVSVRAPLSEQRATAPFLVQDLSHVPAQLASSWVMLFLNQAAQERFWDQNTTANMVLRLRLALAVIAEGVPEVQKSIATWVSFAK
jgi:hypothetical protein